MFGTRRRRRLILGLAAWATIVVLTPPALAEVHVRFGYGGHHGHHSYHKYRSHRGHHRSHRYRSHYGYRHSPSRHHTYRYRQARYYHYGYPSRYAHRRSVARIVVAPHVTSTTSDYPTSPAARAGEQAYAENPSTTHDGWQLFGAGRYRRALNAFAGAAASHPTEGEPKLGYSLSAAMRGDDDRAGYAMRRVLKYEPDVLDRHLPVPIETIQKLIDRYEYQDSDDGRLMLRSLKRLQDAQRERATAESSPSESRN